MNNLRKGRLARLQKKLFFVGVSAITLRGRIDQGSILKRIDSCTLPPRGCVPA